MRNNIRSKIPVVMSIMIISLSSSSSALPIYVGGDPAKVGIVDQHTTDRGEALYDTQPAATGRYDRVVDADTVVPARRYDALPEYYNAANANTLNLSLINGAWYCSPTSALSLIKYWDSDPRFGNLFNPGNGDTDRSVILELARLMDTDDVVDRGAADAAERHLGSRFGDIRPAVESYFNARYPLLFTFGERLVGLNGVTLNNLGYDTAIDRNIPMLLLFTGHMGVGIGYDKDFARTDPRHYRINDPWTGLADIGLDQLGQGRFLPRSAQGIYGILYGEELYGPGNSDYNETPYGVTEDALFHGMIWAQPFEDSPLPDPSQVPEPSTLVLLSSGIVTLWRVKRFRANQSL